MFSAETTRVLGIIRQLRASPAGSDENAIVDFLRSVVQGRLPPQIASALASAIAESGNRIPTKRFAPVSSIHSTGAPGSLSTLLAPVLVAACGIHVPLVSVRGSVAGAIDSLEAIPGYDASLTIEAFLRVLEATKLAHTTHSDQVAPADRILWSLRERVGAKEEPILIAASLLGKKLAVEATYGCIDVRVGPAGNAGKTLDEASRTAELIVSTARDLGMRISCVLSDAVRLPWPRLGRLESLLSLEEILTDPGSLQLAHVRLCQDLAAAACHAADPSIDLDIWRDRVAASLQDGRAKTVFEASIAAHGAKSDWLPQIRREADRRTEIRVQCDADPAPDSISAFFKDVRSRIGSEAGNALGLVWREKDHVLSIHLPPNDHVEEGLIRELAESVQTVGPETQSISPQLIRFDA